MSLIPVSQREENWHKHGNLTAVNGFSRCGCGCKYWKFDQCIDCGEMHDEKEHDK
jgi:hypothetical protein